MVATARCCSQQWYFLVNFTHISTFWTCSCDDDAPHITHMPVRLRDSWPGALPYASHNDAQAAKESAITSPSMMPTNPMESHSRRSRYAFVTLLTSPSKMSAFPPANESVVCPTQTLFYHILTTFILSHIILSTQCLLHPAPSTPHPLHPSVTPIMPHCPWDWHPTSKHSRQLWLTAHEWSSDWRQTWYWLLPPSYW